MYLGWFYNETSEATIQILLMKLHVVCTLMGTEHYQKR